MAIRFGNNGDNGNGGNNERAEAFINCYFPRRDGTLKKLGFFALRASNAEEKELIEYIKKNPDVNMPKVMDRIQMDFRLANAESVGLDLDD